MNSITDNYKYASNHPYTFFTKFGFSIKITINAYGKRENSIKIRLLYKHIL